MSNLQLSGCRTTSFTPFFCEKNHLFSINGATKQLSLGRNSSKVVQYSKQKLARVYAMSSNSNNSSLKMNLNEYMVTLEKPLGLRFAVSVDGKIIVHAIKKGSNAEKSRIIMVGDALKKASDSSDGMFFAIKEFSDTLYPGSRILDDNQFSFSGILIAIISENMLLPASKKMLTEKTGCFSLVLERPFSPFPLQELHRLSDIDVLFNRGRMPVATWNKTVLASNLKATSEGSGNTGFVVFSSRFLTSQGWKLLDHQSGYDQSRSQNNVLDQSESQNNVLDESESQDNVLDESESQNNVLDQSESQNDFLSPLMNQLVCIFSEEESGDGEWAHGSFPLEEYIKALDHSKGELHYNHSLGMRYSKITEQIYVGSCLQTEADVETLSNVGITAVLNFQSGTEAENWGINYRSINESCQKFNILYINYPIRDIDSFDTRKKLPFCVGLLLRLLKKHHHVFVTCTTGFDRSPACVIAYLHWMTDTSLQAAYNFVTGLHECRPDRPAIAWATWDLIAMVESGIHDGPSTHAVTFVWNGHEGEDVYLVGDFTGNWKEPIKATHKGGSRFEVEVRLTQGKYYYKFITNGQWRHSAASPTERDDRGNVNNVIRVGDIASVRPSIQVQKKDANVVKVIERPLTESERFLLAKAARCVAFSVCPIRLSPK